MTRARPRALAAALLALACGSPVARAHDGAGDPAPWDACEGEALGAPCRWEDGRSGLHRGTCRGVADALLCARNQPIVASREADDGPSVVSARPTTPPVEATRDDAPRGAWGAVVAALGVGLGALGLRLVRARRAARTRT